MTIAYVKKNTEGGAAGLLWEAGEVKALDSLFVDELIRLAPGDYEQVSEEEFAPETEVVENSVEEPERPEEATKEIVDPETEAKVTKPRGRKTSSAE